jgi:hypothetical protein
MALAPLPAINEPFVDGTNKVTPKWRAYLQRIEQNLAALETADAGLSTTYIAKSLLTTRGDIIVRDASAPARLALGASGRVLTSDGTDAAWTALPAAGFSLIASGNLPAANLLDITGITARNLFLKISGASCGTATRYLRLRLSIDGGSNFLTSTGFYTASGVITDRPANTSFIPTSTTEGAGDTSNAGAELSTQTGIVSGYFHSSNVNVRVFQTASNFIIATPVNMLRIDWNSTGDFDAGTYELYGL